MRIYLCESCTCSTTLVYFVTQFSHILQFLSGFLVTFLLIAAASSIDVKEGQNIHLKCRYPVEFAAKPTTIYWLQQNREGHDNAAIGDTAFKKDYE